MLELKDRDLMQLGVVTFGPRKKMLLDLEKKRKDDGEWPMLLAYVEEHTSLQD